MRYIHEAWRVSKAQEMHGCRSLDGNQRWGGTRVTEDSDKKQVMERVKRYRQGMANKHGTGETIEQSKTRVEYNA